MSEQEQEKVVNKTMWKCGNCGCTCEGEVAPEVCYFCLYPAIYFSKIETDWGSYEKERVSFMDKCIYCGSSQLIKNVKVGINYNCVVGLRYKKGITGGLEQLHADVCEECGSLSRFPLQEVNRDWVIYSFLDLKKS